MNQKPDVGYSSSILKNETRLRLLLIIGIGMLICMMGYSITQGASDITLDTLKKVFTEFDETNMQHLIVRDIRVPRVIASALIGAALATSGAIMQGITRNPLADSGLLGLNAGAGFALSISFALFPWLTYTQSMFFCFLGAGLGALMVNCIALAGGKKVTPIRLVLSGVAVSAMLTAFSQGIALYFEVSQDIMFWTVGGVSAANWEQIIVILPCVVVALIILSRLANKITMMSLGEDIAKSLGLNTSRVFWGCSLLVVFLAGISVSIVGSISYVGLIIPHISRFLVGMDYRNIIPASIVLGSLLMVVADLFSRAINPPFEAPLGAIIAIIGVPFFLYLARKERRAL